MGKSNRHIKRELERIYGKGCFFNRAHIAERIEAMGGIKTYRKFVEEKRYKGKKISHRITFHHLKHRSEGGQKSVDNGANIEEIAHQYLHSLTRQQEEIINDMLREFKLCYVNMTGNCQALDSGAIQLNFDIGDDCIEIETQDTTLEEFDKKKRNQQKKRDRLRNPTRAMKKRQLQREFDEEEWEI